MAEHYGPLPDIVRDSRKARQRATAGRLTEVYADLRQLIADYGDDERGVIALMPFAASLDQLFHEKYGLELPPCQSEECEDGDE
jgi:hypothetical protein